MSRRRAANAENIVDRLKREHARLDAEAAELDRRLHLTAEEELRLQALKRAKLRTKDRLRALTD